jgi:hypothetical protein
MAENLLAVDQILTRLAEGPKRIAAATAAMTPQQLRTPPGANDWSVNHILAHLRACGDVWGGSIIRILNEDHPAWRAMNPRTWMKQTDYPSLEFAPSYEAYAAQRAELLAVLQRLPPEGWGRTATVTGMIGDVYERSVHFYADSLPRHERAHLRQVERIVTTLGGVA